MKRIIILLLLFIAFYKISYSAATLEAEYLFNNSMTDTSGNGKHGGNVGSPVFVTQNPSPLEGDWSLYNCSDSNYVTLPASAFANVATSGMIRFTTIPKNAGVIFSLSKGGNCYVYLTNGQFQWIAPTTGAPATVNSATGIFSLGIPYTFYICWDSTSYTTYIQNVFEGTIKQVGYLGSISPSFASVSSVQVGRYFASNGFAYTGLIDNFAVYSGVTVPAAPTNNNIIKGIIQFGDSIVEGYSNAGCGTTDGVRPNMINYFSSRGLSYYPIGRNQDGTYFPGGNEGYAGITTGNFLTQQLYGTIFGLLPNDRTSSNIIFLYGNLGTNDVNGVPAASVQTAAQNILNTINAYCPNAKIFMNEIIDKTGYDVTTYNQAISAAYAYGITQGYNMGAYIPINALKVTLCADGVHPAEAGSLAMGQLIGQTIYDVVEPTATITPTITPTPTFTATPTVTPILYHTTPTPIYKKIDVEFKSNQGIVYKVIQGIYKRVTNR